MKRSKLFESVLTLYKNKGPQVLQEYPMQIHFFGEDGIDLGGVSRDMFSGFFEEMYVKLFDGSAVVYPTVHPHVDFDCLPFIGTIISHAYLVTGILPVRIAVPCLAQMLLGKSISIPDRLVVESFIDTLSPHEVDTLKQAFTVKEHGCVEFTEEMKRLLVAILGRYRIMKNPTPDTLKDLIFYAARCELLWKPSGIISAVHSGPSTRCFGVDLGFMGLSLCTMFCVLPEQKFSQ